MQLVAISGIPRSAVGQVLPRLSITVLRSSENGISSTPIVICARLICLGVAVVRNKSHFRFPVG
jgi:hypothetical protein